MKVKVHQDIEGVKSGQTVDVPPERAKWLLANGYASTSAKQDPGHGPSSVDAKDDPRRAENAGDPHEDLYEQMAKGLGKPGEVDPDPVKPTLDNPQPIELTNGDGDPEKAEQGKGALEERAVKATESTPAAEEQVS